MNAPRGRRGPRPVALLVASLLLSAALTACPLATPAAAAPAPPRGAQCGGAPLRDVDAPTASPTALLDAIGTPRAPVSYVMVVDLSASMQRKGRYDRVKREMAAFLAALCPTDQFAVVTFDIGATGRIRRGPVSRASDVLRDLPAAATGRATDIGAGLSVALEEVAAVPANQQTSVVLFSDGDHQPGPRSRYPQPTGAPWDALRERAEQLGGQRPLRAYSIPLASQSGLARLSEVFEGAEDLSAGEPPSSLSQYLGRAQEQARLEQARGLLDSGGEGGVEVRWPDASGVDLASGVTTVGVSLHNTSPAFPVTLRGASVLADGDIAVRADPLPPVVSLAAGQTLEVPVTLRWPPPYRTGFIPGRGVYEADLALQGEVVSATAQGLATLLGEDGSTPIAADLITPDGTVDGEAFVGFGVVRWLALILVLALLAWLLHRAVPRLEGELAILADDVGSERPVLVARLPLRGRIRRARSVAEPTDGFLRVPGHRATVLVHGVRVPGEGAWWGRPRGARVRVWLVPIAGQGRARRGVHDVVVGGRRLLVGLDVRIADAQSRCTVTDPDITAPT